MTLDAENETSREKVPPEKEPEFVGAFSAASGRCAVWSYSDKEGKKTQCENDATHTLVHFAGTLKTQPACDECGVPADVDDWDREWSADV